MKVGTDGVLLGAWTPIENNPFSILDIGAGTGIIALMLAQRIRPRPTSVARWVVSRRIGEPVWVILILATCAYSAIASAVASASA